MCKMKSDTIAKYETCVNVIEIGQWSWVSEWLFHSERFSLNWRLRTKKPKRKCQRSYRLESSLYVFVNIKEHALLCAGWDSSLFFQPVRFWIKKNPNCLFQHYSWVSLCFLCPLLSLSEVNECLSHANTWMCMTALAAWVLTRKKLNVCVGHQSHT